MIGKSTLFSKFQSGGHPLKVMFSPVFDILAIVLQNVSCVSVMYLVSLAEGTPKMA